MKLATHRKKVIVQQAEGLKMMLAARVAQSARQFASHISLMHEEVKVDAKSVLDILTLAVGQGTVLSLEAKGHDAYEAIRHVSGIFEDGEFIETPEQGMAHVAETETYL